MLNKSICTTAKIALAFKIKPLRGDFITPTRATDGSAAFDIYAQDDFTIKPRTPTKINLGFASEIPLGYAAFILPRSGSGCKHGLQLRNTIGLIDSDYRGEWLAVLTLDGQTDITLDFKRGERIAQVAILPIPDFKIEIVDELTDTKRGSGGFGSTGK